MLFIYIILFATTIMVIIFAFKLSQLKSGNQKVFEELISLLFKKISPGSVENLTILPLVDDYTDTSGLETESGVSYLINAENTTILMDTGFNKNGKHPSPLLHNMNSLDIPVSDIDYIFISHLHADHVGGLKNQKNSTFSISNGPVNLPEVPLYCPVKIAPSHWNPGPKPQVLKDKYHDLKVGDNMFL